MPATSRVRSHFDEAAWKKIVKLYADKNYPMSASCNELSANLQSGHAYTLLDFHAFKNGEELVKMRNPWSTEKYKGKWGDQDPNWTEEMKAEIGGLTKANDGAFWMPFEHF